jgi:ornithine cyclodeaminase/alanine dehydrogenase-like protein (mu-crystallin family)
MHTYDQNDIIARLPYDLLTRELPKLLREKSHAPQRHVHDLPEQSCLLLMPAWSDRLGGVKIVNVTPGNTTRQLPCVAASYLLFDAVTGKHLALLDGGELTARRTAAVAAIAADRLAVDGARHLLLVGSGRIASELAFAYSAVRNIGTVSVFSPTQANAEKLVQHLRGNGFDAQVCDNLEKTVPEADIIACATLSTSPLVKGEWLHKGQHVALIGGYLPDMREADNDALQRAEVWIDCQTALTESGDLIGPISHGVLRLDDIRGTLTDLCMQGLITDRENSVTLFKSVGEASQDLAAATLVLNA